MDLNGQVYFSVDIEATGPCPGPYSMISLAAVPFTLDEGVCLDQSFTINIKQLEKGRMHPDTEVFWEDNQKAFDKTKKNAVDPYIAMREFSTYLAGITSDPTFAAWPVVFDFAFVNWYFHTYQGYNPFGYSGFDVQSYALAKISRGSSFRGISSTGLPSYWFDSVPEKLMPHVALDDAIEQAYMMHSMMIDTTSSF